MKINRFWINFWLSTMSYASLVALAPDRAALASDGSIMKARLLADIAFEYAELGDAKQTIAVSEQALQAIAAMEKPCFSANSLAKVGGSYWLLGDRAKGEKLIAEAKETAIAQEKTGCSQGGTSPTESLSNRAREYAEDGHYDFALALSRGGGPQGVTEVAIALLKAGQTQKAEQLIEDALATTRTLKSSREEAKFAGILLNYMARRLKDIGRPDLSRRVIEEALARADENLPQQPDEAAMQIFMRLQTIDLLVDVGLKDRAIALLDKIVPEILALPENPALPSNINSMVDAAVLYQKVGLPERATSLLTRAEQNIRQRSNRKPAWDAIELGRVATGYAKAGNFDRAMTIARSIQSSSERIGAFRSIAFARLDAGDTEGAIQMARASEDTQSIISAVIRYCLAREQLDKAVALQQTYKIAALRSEIANGYLAAGQPERALEIVRSESLEGFKPDIAQSYARNGQPERARQLVESEGMKWLLPSVAAGFAEQGKFDTALEVARSIEAPVSRAQAFIAIASVWSDRDSQPISSEQMGFFQNWLNSIFGKSENPNRDRAANALAQALEITQSLR